jgi:hypothetical protein
MSLKVSQILTILKVATAFATRFATAFATDLPTADTLGNFPKAQPSPLPIFLTNVTVILVRRPVVPVSSRLADTHSLPSKRFSCRCFVIGLHQAL